MSAFILRRWPRAAMLLRDRAAAVSLALLVLIAAAALLAPWLAPQNPYDLAQLELMDSKLPPGAVGIEGTTFWLGTDEQGRDLVSAILYGLRVSLIVGVLATFAAVAIGAALGLVAAYRGGWTDALVMRTADLQLSFPAILIALVLLAALGPGVGKIVIALVAVQWAYYARTVRGIALAEKRKEYVDAAVCLGYGPVRIVVRHILPNCLPPLIVVATVQIAHAIALEATLSFLGLGAPITQPSLGLLIANGYTQLLSGKYWMSFFPGLALVTTIVVLNVAGERLRQALDPRAASVAT